MGIPEAGSEKEPSSQLLGTASLQGLRQGRQSLPHFPPLLGLLLKTRTSPPVSLIGRLRCSMPALQLSTGDVHLHLQLHSHATNRGNPRECLPGSGPHPALLGWVTWAPTPALCPAASSCHYSVPADAPGAPRRLPPDLNTQLVQLQ